MNRITHDKKFNPRRLLSWVILACLVLFGCLLILWIFSHTKNETLSTKLVGASDETAGQVAVELSQEEQTYLNELGPVKICVDPDWEPYEKIDENGNFVGIAADLVNLIGERSGVTFELVPTDDWEESLDESKLGECQVLCFLNESRVRNKWLTFTDSYFSDPSVLIAREDHTFISDLANLTDETMVLPRGTSTEERIRNDYPNIEIILVDTETEAIKMVENRQADMTLRSLTMAAYTIKKEGLFNLKIVEELPSYTNEFRLGVVQDEPMLRDILNRGISTLTPQEVQAIVNKYISVKVQAYDYGFIARMVLIFGILTTLGLLWIFQLRKLNKKLALRQTELEFLSERLNEDIIFRKESEEALRISEEQYRLLFENAVEAILVIQNGKPCLCNHMCEELSGYTKEEFYNLPFQTFIHEDDRERLAKNNFLYLQGDQIEPAQNFKMVRKDGDIRWLSMNAIRIDWLGNPATLNFFVDISEKRKAEDEILYLVYHDQLTDLYNRTYLKQLEIKPDLTHPMAAFMFDIDRLKYVNDNFGHIQGDELIVNVAGFLKKCFEESDTVVRVGGDEFIVIVANCDTKKAEEFTNCIQNAIIDYNKSILEEHLKIGVSMGYTITTDSDVTIEMLMQKADELMYKNKLNRRKD